MSSAPTLRSVRNLALVALGLGAALVVGLWAYKVVKSDPLEAYKKPMKDELPDTVAILMRQTEFKRIEPGKPEATCFVDEMRIAPNRQIYDLQGISKGKLSWNGTQYGFSAKLANWNGYGKQLTLSDSVTLKGPNFEIQTPTADYDENVRKIRAPRPVTGTAMGGKLEVANFMLDLNAETFSTGAGKWSGGLPSEFRQETPGATSRNWDFTFDGSNGSVKRSKEIATYTNARATDGDVIVLAPKIVHNTKTDVLTCTGVVKYFSGKANLIADTITVYRKEKRAVLTGKVTMLVKPKVSENEPPKEVELPPMTPVVPDSITKNRPPAPKNDDAQKQKEESIRSGKNLRDYPLIISAQKIEYWYKKGERRARIEGAPQARQELPEGEWRYAWAASAFYDDEKELLTLESKKGKRDVILKNSIGDEVYGAWGQLSTKEGDDEYEFRDGNAKMRTTDDVDLPPTKKSGGGGLSGPIGNQRT